MSNQVVIEMNFDQLFVKDPKRILVSELSRVQESLNPGSGSAFEARLFYSICKFRDETLFGPTRSQKQLEFDKLYSPVLSALRDFHHACAKLVGELVQFELRLEEGKNWKFDRNALHFLESPEWTCSKLFKEIHSNGYIALRNIGPVTKYLGFDLGPAFKDQKKLMAFTEAIEKEGHGVLSNFLRSNRKAWSETFAEIRGCIEHEGYELPKMEFPVVMGRPILKQPTVGDKTLKAYVIFLDNQLISFIEQLMMYLFNLHFHPSREIQEISNEHRRQEMAIKYQVGLPGLMGKPWSINYETTQEFL